MSEAHDSPPIQTTQLPVHTTVILSDSIRSFDDPHNLENLTTKLKASIADLAYNSRPSLRSSPARPINIVREPPGFLPPEVTKDTTFRHLRLLQRTVKQLLD